MKIIIVSIDSLRADSLSGYGYKKNTSPNIDKIAKDGILFKYAYTQSNWTYPSYYSLITGLYPSTHKIEWFNQRIIGNVPTLPEVLAKKGYKTFLFSNYRTLINKETFGRHFGEAIYFDIDKDWERLKQKFILLKESDFFTLIHIGNYVHEPYSAPREFIRKFWNHDFPNKKVISLLTEVELDGEAMRKVLRAVNLRKILLNSKDIDYLKACYDAGIKYVDKWIGKLYKFLNDNCKDQVLLVITADHGQGFFEHGYFGHGLNLHEELVRVPLIFWEKNKLGKKRINSIVQLIDIFPTIIDILNFRIGTDIDGMSFKPCLDGEQQDRRRAVCEGYPFIAYIYDSKKLITSFYNFFSRKEKIKKLKRAFSDGGPRRLFFHLYSFFRTYFYDLDMDRGEKRNLARKNRKEVLKMLEFLKEWYRKHTKKGLETSSEEIDEKIKEQLRNLGYLD